MKSRKEEMLEPLVDFDVPVEDHSQYIIKVIGVGGGGCNAVSNMYNEGIEGVTFAVCNTDSQALANSPVPVKIMLGESGLGAGANPELGRKEAEFNTEEIRRLLDDGTQMVFVTAGMGGGTGTGAAPVVAAIAREKGLLTVGIVTIPFYFEKKPKIIKALRGVEELRKNVDVLLIVNNERLCDVYADSDITIKEAFQRADNILKDAVKGISEVITIHTDGINLDFRDVEATMRNGGNAIMAIGKADGKLRVENAIMDALDSPLLYGNDIGKAKRILFNIYSSDEHPILVRELQEIDEFFDLLDPNIEVIWGTSTDNSLDEEVKVIILATGMEEHKAPRNSSISSPLGDEEYYEEMITCLYKPKKKAVRQLHQTPEQTEEPQPATPIEEAAEAQEDPQTPHETETPADDEPETPNQPTASGTADDKGSSNILHKWSGWIKNKAAELLTEPDE
mgnify:CR=1 FL=1